MGVGLGGIPFQMKGNAGEKEKGATEGSGAGERQAEIGGNRGKGRNGGESTIAHTKGKEKEEGHIVAKATERDSASKKVRNRHKDT